MRLAIVTTHPIQYQAPWFRALAAEPGLNLEVFFCHRATARDQAEAGFGVAFEWDASLLDGYSHQFLRNVANRPGLDRFTGLDTPDLARMLAWGQFDGVLVSGWNYKSAWQAFWACWRTGTPALVRGDSHLRTRRSLAKQVFKHVAYRAFIPRFDACLAVGRWSADYFRHYGARSNRVFFVPHVVDEPWFEAQRVQSEIQRTALRRSWSLDQDATVFLFVGKFLEGKRPLEFVRAIEVASSLNSRVVGLMSGDGPLRETCQAYVAANQVPVSFTGFLNQSQIVGAYVAADALVVPSVAETWGLVVNEAMICERPCFVSEQVGCGPDLILEGKTGAIVPVENVSALGALLAQYSGDRPRLYAMGQAAREHLDGYSIRAAVDGVLEALETVRRR
jgi:glycosyltransferase involved in cell wall biosynthesis